MRFNKISAYNTTIFRHIQPNKTSILIRTVFLPEVNNFGYCIIRHPVIAINTSV